MCPGAFRQLKGFPVLCIPLLCQCVEDFPRVYSLPMSWAGQERGGEGASSFLSHGTALMGCEEQREKVFWSTGSNLKPISSQLCSKPANNRLLVFD